MEGKELRKQTSGEMRREIAKLCLGDRALGRDDAMGRRAIAAFPIAPKTLMVPRDLAIGRIALSFDIKGLVIS